MMTGIWAGAQMTPVNHSKMVHGGGALTRLELPFLNLDIHGERFMNEVLSFAYLNNLMRGYLEEYDFQNPMAAKFFTIMPANWAEIGEQWTAAHPEEVKFGVGNMKVPSEDQFVKGETFAELAANINAYMEAEEWHIDPIDEQAIVASIEAYNELCATGSDGQFGKRADYLVPIEQGPFFAVPRGANSVPAVLGIAATLLARRIVPLSSHHWARFGSLAAMLAASLCLIAAPEFPSAAVPLGYSGRLAGSLRLLRDTPHVQRGHRAFEPHPHRPVHGGIPLHRRANDLLVPGTCRHALCPRARASAAAVARLSRSGFPFPSGTGAGGAALS